MNKKNNDTQIHFLIVGHEGSHNKGCEALVRTCIQILSSEFENAKYTLVSEHPDHDYVLLNIDGINIVHAKSVIPKFIDNKSVIFPRIGLNKILPKSSITILRKILHKILPFRSNKEIYSYEDVKHLKDIMIDCDAVISIGGDMFIDDWGPPLLAMKTMEYAKTLNKKTIIWGQSFWNVKDSGVKKRIQSILNDCNCILVRDEGSNEYLSSIGINKNVVLTADGAFLMIPEKVSLESSILRSSKLIIGFNGSPVYSSFIDASQHKFLVEALVTFMQNLIDAYDATLVLIPHDSYPAPKERAFLYELSQKIDRPNSILIPPIGLSAPEIKGYISFCKFFISMRFHATIAALSQCIPTIALGYSPKFGYLFRSLMGNTKYVLKYEDISFNTLESVFESIRSNEHAIKSSLKENVDKFQKLAMKNSIIIREILDKN